MASATGGVGDEQTEWKRAAARAAVADVPENVIIGLGSGSTAELMLEELAARVRAGLRVTAVPTSERIRSLASGLGIPLLALDSAPALHLSIDGADEVVLPALQLVKGHGGALLREKLVAASSHMRIIIVDQTKLVDTLGARHPLPVEVIPFGWVHTAQRRAALGCQPLRRLTAQTPEGTAEPQPYLTDSGNYILDCATEPITDPYGLAQAIKAQVGVVEHGLFVGMTEKLYVGGPDGVRTFTAGG